MVGEEGCQAQLALLQSRQLKGLQGSKCEGIVSSQEVWVRSGQSPLSSGLTGLLVHKSKKPTRSSILKEARVMIVAYLTLLMPQSASSCLRALYKMMFTCLKHFM